MRICLHRTLARASYHGAVASVFALFGPTGVGKTEVAIALAARLRARGERPVAVSADALQVYEGLEVLTGVAAAHEQETLEHRLVSFLPVDRTFSVGEYAAHAHREIDGLLAEGATPIVVGGTGLYLRAALATLDLKPAPPPEVRERWMRVLEQEGLERTHARLAAVAPAIAASIDPRDRHRVVRALELHELGALDDAPPEENRLWTSETRHPTRLLALVMEREALYRRIEARVDAMVAAGAIDEVRRAHAAGASPTARKALGFDELLRGDVEAMKRRTRQYAKRQLTWLRKLPGCEVLDVTGRGAGDVARDVV
ncbi:MAG: tRNA (adenosine(37)-N6)-dimethylallyltransferase MiaA [Solirubrobacterales bacterium]|nr:tRNA (adenosine(37)-N6)-dimethylallyltransferase MiaA [Solirubrobacterales bacterium]